MSAPEPGTGQPPSQPAVTAAAAVQPVIHPMQLSFGVYGSSDYGPATGILSPTGNGNGASVIGGGGNGGGGGGGGSGSGGGGDQVRKKRGRPRKYAADGSMSAPAPAPPPPPINAVPLAAAAVQQSVEENYRQQSQNNHQQQSQNNHQQSVLQYQPQLQNNQQQPMSMPLPPQQSQLQGGGALDSSGKRRGRPLGSVNKKQQQQQHQVHQQQEQLCDSLASPGIGFTPHVITVNTGEDVSSKIMSFSQHGPRAICILSANGTISSVTLRQSATSGGSVTYEGRFEILSLSGSFMISEHVGGRSRTGGLSVSLAGPDGRVIGGGVAGLLTAASPVQVVVGSFIADGKKEVKNPSPTEPLVTPSRLHSMTGPTGPSSPLSRGTLSETSGGSGSPPNQSAPPGISNLPWK